MDTYAKYYNLEKYIFSDVSRKFQREGSIGAFDFFCIIIWKAERAKTKIAGKLIDKYGNLEVAARKITKRISEAQSREDKLTIALDVEGFRLPMASALLSVLYPEEFTVYDIRVCDQLKKYHNLAYIKNPVPGYFEFLEEVRKHGSTLREADKELWGKNFKQQLEQDINNQFEKRKG